MFAIIAAVLLGIASVFEVLLIMGLPLGEFTMGGQYKVLPTKLRIMVGFSIILQIFAGMIVLQTGRYVAFLFPKKVTKIICYVFSGYFLVNTIMNLCSYNKKEKYVMTPLAAIAGICFWITAFQMT